jgi:protein-disulfide isomerase
MSKQADIHTRRQHERKRNRILVIGLVTMGALLIGFAFILPLINSVRNSGTETPDTSDVTPITPKVINAAVNGQHLGDPNAPVKIDVWEDFQCPACKNYSLNVETLVITNYVETGKVYYTYHFFPLIDGGKPNGESHQSASAAMCASEQGRFWDFHAILFANWDGENQGSFADARLVAFAKSLGLDLKAFNTCFESKRYSEFINQDLLAGKTAGVSGTPSVFVNGQIVTPGYVPSFDQLAAVIENALAGK